MGKPTFEAAWRGLLQALPKGWGVALSQTSTGKPIVQLIEQVEGQPEIRWARSHPDIVNLLQAASSWARGQA